MNYVRTVWAWVDNVNIIYLFYASVIAADLGHSADFIKFNTKTCPLPTLSEKPYTVQVLPDTISSIHCVKNTWFLVKKKR